MTDTTQELIKICEALPPTRVEEVVDFARFLQQQESGDAAWERIIAQPRPRPKLDQFIAEALTEEPSEPFDANKL